MTPFHTDSAVTLYAGDCREVLRSLSSKSVQTVVTSPPYWRLRDYGVAGQLGLEPTPDEYVDGLVDVFREVRRVLRDDGTVWLNLGDTYASTGGHADESCNDRRGSYNIGTRPEHEYRDFRARPSYRRDRRPREDDPHKGAPGLKPKDLVGIPWRVAFALQADGWWLRRDIIWNKPNPMPESVEDRCTTSHEYIFHLSKAERYYYDAEAIKERAEYREPNAPDAIKSPYGQGFTRRALKAATSPRQDGNPWNECNGRGFIPVDPGWRNKRSVWTVATQAYGGAHSAVFPENLIKPCILAGSPAGGTVLDPFAGAGTTLYVAKEFGRNAIGIELNPDYCSLAVRRLHQEVLPI